MWKERTAKTGNVVASLWDGLWDPCGLAFTTLYSSLPHHAWLGRSRGTSLLRLGYIKLSIPSWALAVSFFPSWISPGCHVVSSPIWQDPRGKELRAAKNHMVWKQTSQPEFWDDRSPSWELNYSLTRHLEPEPPATLLSFLTLRTCEINFWAAKC